jgi:hypothetical protein
VTAGLLEYWSIPSLVVSLESRTGRHALTLIRTRKIPAGFRTIELGEQHGDRAGAYIPIDYEKVGALSTAVAPVFRVTDVWLPQSIYGREM